MSQAPTVVGIPASLRAQSYTATAVKYALSGAAEAGATAQLLDLREQDLPLYDPDKDEQGDSEAVVATVREADGILLGSPVYHSSYSSAFKNLHDYCSYDDFENTVVGLLATAGGDAYSGTLDHMRATIRGVHGWVLPKQAGIPNAYDQFKKDPDAIDGRSFVDPDLQERIEELGQLVTVHARTPTQPPAVGTDD